MRAASSDTYDITERENDNRHLLNALFLNCVESIIMASWWLSTVFLGSVLTNSATALYLVHKHSIKRSLFFIVLLNAIITAISSLVIFIVLVIDIQNPFLCSCLVLGLAMTSISTLTLNAMAAHVR